MPTTPSTSRAKRYSGYAGIAALAGMAALSPLSLAGADPEGSAPAPVTVTATVTAMVAPDQCDPLPDGQLPQTAVDYASDGAPITTAPVTTEAPAPSDVEALVTETSIAAAPRAAEEGGEISGTGPFDPYLCAPAAATPTETSKTVTVTPEAVPDDDADIAGVPTSLRPAKPNVDEVDADGYREAPADPTGASPAPTTPRAQLNPGY